VVQVVEGVATDGGKEQLFMNPKGKQGKGRKRRGVGWE